MRQPGISAEEYNRLGGEALKLRGFQHGGQAGSTDTIPAMLSPGEFVMRAKAVGHYGTRLMHAINSLKFQEGGNVGPGTQDPEAYQRWLSANPPTHGIVDRGETNAQLEKRLGDEAAKRAEEAFRQAADSSKKFYACCEQIGRSVWDKTHDIDAAKAAFARCGSVYNDPGAQACEAKAGTQGFGAIQASDVNAWAEGLKRGFAGGGPVGLDKPIGLASGGCVGGCSSAMTERRFTAPAFASGGLSSVATNLQGGGGLRNASHDVHLHLADGSTFKMQAEAAVVGTMMRSSAVQRMARIGRRSSAEG
jgi:hypothetical protein